MVTTSTTTTTVVSAVDSRVHASITLQANNADVADNHITDKQQTAACILCDNESGI